MSSDNIDLVWESPTVVENLEPAETLRITGLPDGGQGWILKRGLARFRISLPDSADGSLADVIRLTELARLLWRRDIDALAELRGPFFCMFMLPQPGIALAFRGSGGGRTGYYRVHCDGNLISCRSHLIADQLDDFDEDYGFLSNHFGLTGIRPAGSSAFACASELMPGELLILEKNGHSVERASVNPGHDNSGLHQDQQVDVFRRRFTEAVAATLPAGEDVGVMASGGLDSGPTACVAAALLKSAGHELHALSWRLPNFPRSDEWAWIQALCRHVRIPLHPIDADSLLPFSRLDTGMTDPDIPSFNAFRPMINMCYSRAQELGIKTILNASSGDHLYPNPDIVLGDLLYRGRVTAAIDYLARAFRIYGHRIDRDPGIRGVLSRVKRRMMGNKSRPPPNWLTNDAAAHFTFPGHWPPECLQYRWPDYARQLAGMATMTGVAQENAFSNRFGVERNDPFQDIGLIRLALALPPSSHFHRGSHKYLMREAMRGLLPEAHRTKVRTGLLHSFFRAGFDANRDAVREFLLDQPTWQKWVRREYVQPALESAAPDTARAQVVIVSCIGYTLWRQKLADIKRRR